jgi:trehalose 6-phosphate synthase
MRPVAERFGGTWIASALGPDDLAVSEGRPGAEDLGFDLRLLPIPPEVHTAHYDIVCNEHLWFLFHYLFDVAEWPRFDRRFMASWDAYRQLNAVFAKAVLETPGADVVMIQDYHLMTVASEIRRRRSAPSVPLVYFHHVPWVEPDYFGMLPPAVRKDILIGLLAHDVAGFHATRWARAFLQCCDRFLDGAIVSDDDVTWSGRRTRVLVAPAPIHPQALAELAASPDAERWRQRLQERSLGRRTLLRVERIDLSKNVLRGLLAFEDLLERRPELRESVWFCAFGYPSRTRVARYRRYLADCRDAARRINERFASGEETAPVVLEVSDDHHRSIAGMQIADVMLVNPVFDGLNMVAKEAPALNERDGVLVLSRNAGAWEELGTAAIGISPFDVSETSEAIEKGLDMPAGARATRASRLKRLVSTTTPEGWVRGQLLAAGLRY